MIGFETMAASLFFFHFRANPFVISTRAPDINSRRKLKTRPLRPEAGTSAKHLYSVCSSIRSRRAIQLALNIVHGYRKLKVGPLAAESKPATLSAEHFVRIGTTPIRLTHVMSHQGDDRQRGKL